MTASQVMGELNDEPREVSDGQAVLAMTGTLTLQMPVTNADEAVFVKWERGEKITSN